MTVIANTRAGERAEAQIGFSGRLVRPDDQLRLTFELFNGTVDAVTNRIQPLIETEGIFYVVAFGSQHTTESTVPSGVVPPDEARAHRRALPSRVSVEVLAGTELTAGNLVDLAAYALRVDPRADGADGDRRQEPAADMTSIEVPASLILSPPSGALFDADTVVRTRHGVAELWRAHLRSGGGPGTRPTVRAIARRSDALQPSDDLDLLVEQTTGSGGVPLDVAALVLSSHGADVDVSGAWASGLLAAYRHRAVAGRDLRIEIVERGYLAPFGHAASLTTLTERQLLDDACLLTRDGVDLVLSYTATDRAGHGGITFQLPAVFVAEPHAHEPGDSEGGRPTVLAELATWYAESAEDARRDLHLGGQSVSWADPSPRGGAGSAQATNRIRIALDRPDTAAYDADVIEATLRDLGRPAFYPAVDAAWVVDQAVMSALGTSTFGGEPPEVAVTVALRWLEHGLGDLNVDLGYLDLTTPTAVVPTTDALGMLGASLDVGTFGQVLGAGSKFPELGDDGWVWDPIQALGDVVGPGGGLPKLLGSLRLTDLIPSLDLRGLDVPDGPPAVRVEPQFDHPDVPEIPTGVCELATWVTTVVVTDDGTPQRLVVEEREPALVGDPPIAGGDVVYTEAVEL